MSFTELTGVPSIEKFVRNGVDYTFDLLGRLIFLFMRRLSLVSLRVVSLSSSIFCSVSSFAGIVITVVLLLVSFGSRSCCVTLWPLHELG